MLRAAWGWRCIGWCGRAAGRTQPGTPRVTTAVCPDAGIAGVDVGAHLCPLCGHIVRQILERGRQRRRFHIRRDPGQSELALSHDHAEVGEQPRVGLPIASDSPL